MSGTDVSCQKQIIGVFVVPEIDPAAVNRFSFGEKTRSVAVNDIDTFGRTGASFDIYDRFALGRSASNLVGDDEKTSLVGVAVLLVAASDRIFL